MRGFQMEWWQILLAVLFTAAWFIPFLIEVIITPIKDNIAYNKKFQSWSKAHPDLQRIQCKTCKYAKKETIYSGRYPNGYPKRYVSYCALIHKRLDGINFPEMRCQLAEPPEYFYESKNEEKAYPAQHNAVFFSPYSDRYHSTPHCRSLKKSPKIYSGIIRSDRYPCSLCWIKKDGKLYPKN